jgi:triphosphatase
MADIASDAHVTQEDTFTHAASKLSVYLWSEAWGHADGVVEGDAHALHQMRVALRRLRSLLENCAHPDLEGSAIAPHIAEEMLYERRALGKLGDALGAVRDFDVLDDYLRTYAKDIIFRDVSASQGLARFDEFLRHERDQNFAPMVKRIERTRRPHKQREDFARWAHSLAGVQQPETPLSQAAPQVLALRIDEALAKGHVLQSEDEEEQHELRKSLRRLRYTLEAFDPAFGKTKPFVKVLVSLQDTLGEMQDRTVLRAMLKACFQEKSLQKLPEDARLFAEYGDRRREELLQQMRADWKAREESGFWDEMRAI